MLKICLKFPKTLKYWVGVQQRMFAHGSASLQLFLVVWIFLRSLGVIYFDRWVLSEGPNNYFKDWCLMNSHPTYLNLVNYGQLSKACKPENFESHNSLTLSFMSIRGLCLNFVDCQSFLESNSLDILALFETNLDGSIDSDNFSWEVIFL